MEVSYEDTDITEYVAIDSCIIHDTCGARCDSIEVDFENADGWMGWQPKEDERIRITHNGYDSGIMYVHSVVPAETNYRIYATSLPCRARISEWQSYRNLRFDEILRLCAAKDGLDCASYGMDVNTAYPYLQRENESCAAFLHRLCTMEGARLKTCAGRYAAIDLRWAQQQTPGQSIELENWQQQAEYSRSGRTYRNLILHTYAGDGLARDSAVESAHAAMQLYGFPANSLAEAGRWARNLLLDANRQAETIWLDMEFNPGLTAMVRIDITGTTDASGEWLIEDVEHDLINLRSIATLHRCLTTIS